MFRGKAREAYNVQRGGGRRGVPPPEYAEHEALTTSCSMYPFRTEKRQKEHKPKKSGKNNAEKSNFLDILDTPMPLSSKDLASPESLFIFAEDE